MTYPRRRSLHAYGWLIGLFVLIFGVVPAAAQNKPEKAKPVVVAGTLEEPIDSTRTTVYCVTFQAAWNRLAEDIIHGDVKLADAPELADRLNKGRLTPIKLPESFFFFFAGRGPAAVKQINQSLKKQFGRDAPTVQEDLTAEDVIAYAFLKRDLPFANKFEPCPHLSFTAGSRSIDVRGFGVSTNGPEELRKQVLVYRYEAPDDFIVILEPRDKAEQIMLVRTAPGKSLGEMVKEAEKTISDIVFKRKPYMTERDSLAIPTLAFRTDHAFAELIRPFAHFPKPGMWSITKAIQSIDFHLDEYGAKVQSEAKIVGRKSVSAPTIRHLTFDEPFLIYITRRGNEKPYFAAWIGDTVAMQQADGR